MPAKKKRRRNVVKKRRKQHVSPLEDKFAALCAEHGWPRYEREKKGLIHGRRFRVDFYFESMKLVVEIDGVGGRASSHRSAVGVSYDRERDALFMLAGYRILRFTTHHFKKNCEYIIRTMNEAVKLWE